MMFMKLYHFTAADGEKKGSSSSVRFAQSRRMPAANAM
jgi:hypothetical protein